MKTILDILVFTKNYFAPFSFLLFLFVLGCNDNPIDDGGNENNQENLEQIIPEDAGYSSAKLKEASKFAETSGFDAVMVLYDGKILFSWGDVSENYLLHSIRKPMLSGLYGIHVANGNINLDATLEELEIDDIPPSLTSAEKQARVRDLIKSRSGVYHVAAAELDGIGWTESRPERGGYPPNTFFYYNNWDFNAAGTIFEQETGTKIFEEFAEKIAKQIGMQEFDSENCYYQYEYEKSMHPAYHFRMSCRDLARYGELYRNRGNWKGNQIIPENWVDESLTAWSYEDSSLGLGYGYMWRIYEKGGMASNLIGGYAAFGHTGLGGVQTLMVVPELKLVLVERTNTDEAYEDKELGLELGLMILNARESNL
jgi:CubicO group peptidase (beta-lactamase class C family)